MINANKMQLLPATVKSKLGIVFVSGLAMLSGCASNTLEISSNLRKTPEISRSNMSSSIACMASALQKGNSQSAYIFLVRDINDGTVKEGPYQDSPLSDAGRIQLINVLSEHLYPHVGLVTDNFPTMFTQIGKEDVGLNRFGMPSPENLNVFISAYSGVIQNARNSRGLPTTNSITPLIVSGAFTRFDTDNIAQEGVGNNLGTRTKRLAENELDEIWRKPTGEMDFGNTSSARALSLVLTLTDPRNNLVVASQSFDLVFYRSNKSFRLRVGMGEGYYGISKDNVVVEGVHSAQKTLLDAAAFWLLNKAYGGQTNFGGCFLNDAQQKLNMTTEQFAEISESNRAAQQALAEKAIRARRNTSSEKDDKEGKTDKNGKTE